MECTSDVIASIISSSNSHSSSTTHSRTSDRRLSNGNRSITVVRSHSKSSVISHHKLASCIGTYVLTGRTSSNDRIFIIIDSNGLNTRADVTIDISYGPCDRSSSDRIDSRGIAVTIDRVNNRSYTAVVGSNRSRHGHSSLTHTGISTDSDVSRTRDSRHLVVNHSNGHRASSSKTRTIGYSECNSSSSYRISSRSICTTTVECINHRSNSTVVSSNGSRNGNCSSTKTGSSVHSNVSRTSDSRNDVIDYSHRLRASSSVTRTIGNRPHYRVYTKGVSSRRMVVHHSSDRTVVSSNRSTKRSNRSHTRTSIHVYSDVGRTSNGWVDVVDNGYSLSTSSSVTSDISNGPKNSGSSKWIDTRCICSTVEVIYNTHNRAVVRSSRCRHSNVCSAKTSSNVSSNVSCTCYYWINRIL